MKIIFFPEEAEQFSLIQNNFLFTNPKEIKALCWLAAGQKGNILEIGCNRGVTTCEMASAFPKKTVYALDNIQGLCTMTPQQKSELPPTHEFCQHAKHLPNVIPIDCDSGTLNYNQLKSVDFIFIDGDHSYEAVRKDSINALCYLRKHKGGIIAWHDYRPASKPHHWMGVKRYIDECIRPIYEEITWIDDTRLAFLKVEKQLHRLF